MNLSRKLAEHGFKIIFVNSDFNHKLVMASSGEAQETLIMESSIKFMSIPDGLGPEGDRTDGSKLIPAIAKNMPTSLEKIIKDVNGSCNVISCIVADVNMGWALEVARKMGIRRASYFTFAAAMFALLPSIPRLADDGIIDCNDVNNGTKNEYPNEFQGKLGKLVQWAPQRQVLSHPAIACFISHCGWNSVMEGLSNGVPFLCWPYMYDQLFNKYYICDKWKVGLGFDSDEKGIVSSGEIKKKVEQLHNDQIIRDRSTKLMDMLKSEIAEGGQSWENFNKFVKWLKE